VVEIMVAKHRAPTLFSNMAPKNFHQAFVKVQY